jgi:predicted RecB family nuclease
METELHIPGVSVPIVGFIDMIQNDGVPIDIKTASKRWSQDKADNSLQATFYIATLEQLGMIKLPATFKFMVFTKTKNPAVQVLETTRTHQDVFALYSRVNEVWKAIQREVFTPTDPDNWWCSHKYCSFWDVCEYGGRNGR